MLLLYCLFILYQSSLIQSVGTVKFNGPVHVNPDRKYEFSCYFSTKEPFQMIEILFTNNYNQVITVTGSDCEIPLSYRGIVSDCQLEDGVLKYKMIFNQIMEGIYICKINSKKILLMDKINILFNASSPIFNMTRKEIYYTNETVVASCRLENNNQSGLGVFLLMTYKDGVKVEINRANTTLSSKVNGIIYLNKWMNGALLGCGIQYEYSNYIENYMTLNIGYLMEEIQLRPIKTYYYYNDSVLCFTDGNPNPEIQWEAISESQSMNDTIIGARLTFSERLGNRTFTCTAKQNFTIETLTFRKNFTFDVALFTTVATTMSPTPRWTNINLTFVGDRFSKSNGSQHYWELVPKWVGFINGSMLVNDKEKMYFNSTDVIQYPPFISDVVITSYSIAYKISEPALHGKYILKILNRYNEIVENETIFIRGENPTLSLVGNGRNYTVTCTTNDLGSPASTLRIFKHIYNTNMDYIKEGTNISYTITKNIYLEWTDDGTTLVCVNVNEHYRWISNSIRINISFPVRDMEITPDMPQYGSGDIVKCSAKGNPLPVIVWSSNMNYSFTVGPNPGVIQLTPRSSFDLNYTCTATNNIGGQSYSISRSIIIRGSPDEFMEFSAMPPFVRSFDNVSISCSVRILNAINAMDINDNDEKMISYTPNVYTVSMLYRKRISGIVLNETTLSFLVSFRNDSERNISCQVLFQSTNRLEKRIELRNIIDIIYEKSNVAAQGASIHVSCLQRLRNGVVVNMGLYSNTHLVFNRVSNASDPVKFTFLVTGNMHGSKPYCSLEDSNVELGRAWGDQLFIVYVSEDLQINPYKTEYDQSETIVCTGQGRPEPNITWNLKSGNNYLVANESVLVLSKGDGQYVYECVAESVYKTERAFVKREFKFLVTKSLGQRRSQLNITWIIFLLMCLIF